MRILYDTSYCYKGLTGIPSDARSLSRILVSGFENTSLLIRPKTSSRFSIKKITTQSELIGDALRIESGQKSIPPIMTKICDVILASLSVRKIRFAKVNNSFQNTLAASLASKNSSDINFLITNKSVNRTWARLILRRPYKLSTSGYDFFIQQHVEPIRISRGTKQVVRLHDILPITHPEYFNYDAVKLFNLGLKALLRNKEIYWVMDSHQAAEEFKHIFGKHLKVWVIPCAIDNKYVQSSNEIKKVKKILSLCTIEPRKNVDLIINAFEKFQELKPNSKDWELVIAGGKGWQTDSLYKRLVDGKLPKNVTFIEKPSDDEVFKLLGESAIFISASFAEGFGLPPLEALAMNCKILASDIPQHRETLQNYASYFKHNLQELADLLVLSTGQKDISEKNFPGSVYVKENFSEENLKIQWLDFLKNNINS